LNGDECSWDSRASAVDYCSADSAIDGSLSMRDD
jgi:hypothetical protein